MNSKKVRWKKRSVNRERIMRGVRVLELNISRLMPSPQKVEIKPAKYSEESVNYVNPYDVVPIPTNYSLPYGHASPPKPPRTARKFQNAAFDKYINLRPSKQTSTPELTNIPLTSFPSIDSDGVNMGRSKATEPVYAKVTPKKLRQSALQSSVFVPKSDTESPASSKTSLTVNSYSQDFTPKATSSRNDILESEMKDSSRNWPEQDDLPKNQSLSKTAVEKKFVTNIFESRPSRRWEKHVKNSNGSFQKRTFIRMSLDSRILARKNLEKEDLESKSLADINKNIEKLEIESKKLKVETNKLKKQLRRTKRDSVPEKKNDVQDFNKDEMGNSHEDLHQYSKYLDLKRFRDIECSRITQASGAIREIRHVKNKTDWKDVLFLEKILLESSERVNLLTQQINDNIYSVIPEPALHKGTIHLSNIKFPFSKTKNHKVDKHFTRFFIMTISDGSKLFISDFISEKEGTLSFNNTYIFEEVAPDFELKVKLFCVKLRTSHQFFWEKLGGCSGCQTSKIIYEDQLTRQYKEKTVLKSSFKTFAEVNLSSAQINDTSAKINADPQIFNGLDGVMEYNLKCTDINISVSLSDFLDVGTLLGETYFWERKWCVLKGPNLAIYNYPQDEHFGKPVEQINLEYCFGPIITKIENCPRRRCFQLRTGRPNDAGQNSLRSNLKSKPNFALQKFFFATRNKIEYLQWTVEVEKLLHSLCFFKKLVFYGEYEVV
ncbi:unnamed protein product [Ceutorhynchus assimilis]|uniref:PH domain-containing protein n=1 Tax=Ceutorhynchus assimilis TaxID=467358 RepID=A0A9N9MPS4_9CUCU|nr:unnamed protein product [Ceutorhynchus assimilis]